MAKKKTDSQGPQQKATNTASAYEDIILPLYKERSEKLKYEVKKNRKFSEEVLAGLEKQGLQIQIPMRAKAKEYGIDFDSMVEDITAQKRVTEYLSPYYNTEIKIGKNLERQLKEMEDTVKENLTAAIDAALAETEEPGGEGIEFDSEPEILITQTTERIIAMDDDLEVVSISRFEILADFELLDD